MVGRRFLARDEDKRMNPNIKSRMCRRKGSGDFGVEVMKKASVGVGSLKRMSSGRFSSL